MKTGDIFITTQDFQDWMRAEGFWAELKGGEGFILLMAQSLDTAQSCRRQIYKLWGCGSRFLWLLAGTSSGHTGSIYFQFELATNSLNPKAVTFTSFGKRTKDNGLGEKNRKCCCTVQRKKSMRDFRGDKSHLLPLFFLGKKSDDI